MVLSIVGVAGYHLYQTFDESNFTREWITFAVVAVLLLLVVSVFLGYIGMLLEDFVIPIMYKHSVSVTDGWYRTLTLQKANPGRFLLYALWRLLMALGSAFVILAVILITCCIGAIVMAIPVLGAVLLRANIR